MKENAVIGPEVSPRLEPSTMNLTEQVSKQCVVRLNEPIAKRTTLRVGGPADYYVEPADKQDLAAVLRFCGENSLSYLMLGRGSNLLIRDEGIRGVVICLAHPNFSRISIDGERLVCGAGARLKTVAVEAKRGSLAGLEFFEGIPGTVGGALRMNAGAMGGATFDLVESVRVMDFKGSVSERPLRELRVSYRSCETLKKEVALSAVFHARPGAREAIEQVMNQFSKKRRQSQPAAPSAGCIFKNPASIPAGKLIDELGLKGTRVGGAYVSVEHGNFIVNDGTARAKEVIELIEIIRARARAERGIELETEVEIVGE